MDFVWLSLAFVWLMVAVVQLIRFRKTKNRVHLIACVTMFVAAGVFALVPLRTQTRPQLDLVNAGKDPILVTVEGEFEVRKLVPAQEVSTRYDLGADLTIMCVTNAGPGERKSFPLPDGKNKEVFKATVQTDAAGAIRVRFSDGSSK
ncbi:MAG: hypothetical protein ACYSX0_14625 [Planctomycetota bacterium]|jgi:hypothetical protein